MSLKIRLSRGGAKKRPFYQIVVADSRSPRDGRFIENLGFFNPMVERDNPDRLRFKRDRLDYWLGQGAKPSDRVARFLGEAEVLPAFQWRETPSKSAPKAKAQEMARERAEKEQAAKEAAEAAKAEAEAAAAAPAEEAPAEEASAEETPAEETAAEETAAEETAAEEAAGEDDESKG